MWHEIFDLILWLVECFLPDSGVVCSGVVGSGVVGSGVVGSGVVGSGVVGSGVVGSGVVGSGVVGSVLTSGKVGFSPKTDNGQYRNCSS